MAARFGGQVVVDAWLTRLRRTDPLLARCYCDHGVYVGWNRVFAAACTACPTERTAST